MSETSGRSVRLTLCFDYDHPLGARDRFFAELSAGRALGAICPQCGATTFPPRARCREDGRPCRELPLSGVGRVLAMTRSETQLPLANRSLATTWTLVRMEGADNGLLGRLAADSRQVGVGDRVRLVADTEPVGHPIQHLTFVVDPSDEP